MFDQLAPCSSIDEGAFGPSVSQSCLNGFDFTLLFEESILTLLPLAITLLFAPVRIGALLPLRSPKARLSWLWGAKSLCFVAYIALQLALLGIWSSADIPKTKTTVATAAVSFVGFVVLFVVSYLEHVGSLRPSTLLNIYLGLSCLLDLARVRTLFFMPESHTVASLFVSSFAVKTLLLCLEATEKRHLLIGHWQDKSSPEDTAGVANRSLFLWLNSLFIKGFGSVLTVDTLTELDQDILDCSKPSELEHRWKEADQGKKNALLWTFLWYYKWQFLAGVAPRLAYTAFQYAQPFLIQRVLDFLDEPTEPNSKNYAYGLTAAYAIVYIGISVSYAVYEHKTYRLLTMVRGSLVTMIYDKTLRISTTAVKDAESVTLMSADIDRIGLGLREIHEIYASVVELALSLWLLERLLGLAMVASTIWIILCLAIGMPIAVLAGNAQEPWLEAIEKRLAVTSNMLAAMTGIKITGLAEPVATRIRDLRKQEIKASLLHRFYTVLVVTFSYISSSIAPVWGFGTYILMAQATNGTTLTSSIAFAALTLYALQDKPLISLVDGFEEISTVVISFTRIQEYLTSSERDDQRSYAGSTLSSSRASDSTSPHDDEKFESEKEVQAMSRPAIPLDDNITAELTEASGSYSRSGRKKVIRNVSATFEDQHISMIAGPVGCGKSTLLRMLLGELPIVEGSIQTRFKHAAYCSQTPWITFGTIQQNILGASLFDQAWYRTVTRACSLDHDFAELPLGDQTKTGSRGSRLSGGQQMRVSLARALYSRREVLILDDVLTGLDRITEAAILDAVFSPTGLIKARGLTVVMATNSAHHLRYADKVIALAKDGSCAEQGPFQTLVQAGGYVERLASEHQQPTEARVQQLELSEETLEELGLEDDEEDEIAQLDKKERQQGDLKVYNYYFSVAGYLDIAIYLLACCAFVFGLTFPTIWVQKWTDANEQKPNSDIGYWLGVYAALGVICALSIFGSSYLFMMYIVPKTARRFHEYLLSTTIGATTAFLTSTDLGTTTNRFSQDLQLIDNDLPTAFEMTMMSILSAIAESVLVFIGSGYVAAVIPGVIVIVYIIQKYYLRTSRQLRLLDIEAKAPLFSQFLETLGGVSSIRSYGWTETYASQNIKVLDRSQKPYYLLWCIQRWLTLVLDLLVAGIALLLVAIATNVRNSTTAYLGVALFNIVSFSGTLQQLVTQWVELETAIGAVSRIRAYVRRTKPESKPGEDGTAPDEWPKNGSITFTNVSASYETTENDPVLKNISLSILPGEKVAIVGRTGSGKSSLVSTVLRLLEIDNGSVKIDDVDLAGLPRQLVRERLNVLPQQPFFLHGSVRQNLNPLISEEDEDNEPVWSGEDDVKSYSEEDQELVEALRTVGLWSHLTTLHAADPDEDEDEEMDQSDSATDDGATEKSTRDADDDDDDGEENEDEEEEPKGPLSQHLDSSLLSHGQRQLFCLARAIISAKHSSILILDEATSHVDAETDALMQRVLREKFIGKTTIAIVHKLHTTLDFDRVVVLGRGEILETGPPMELLSRSGGAFKALYDGAAAQGSDAIDDEGRVDEDQ